MKKIPDIKIKIQSNIRSYVYVAHIVATPPYRLRKITAGCRTWKNFNEARQYYSNDGVSHWADVNIGNQGLDPFDTLKRKHIRYECQRIIEKLELQADVKQRLLRNAHRETRRRTK